MNTDLKFFNKIFVGRSWVTGSVVQGSCLALCLEINPGELRGPSGCWELNPDQPRTVTYKANTLPELFIQSSSKNLNKTNSAIHFKGSKSMTKLNLLQEYKNSLIYA